MRGLGDIKPRSKIKTNNDINLVKKEVFFEQKIEQHNFWSDFTETPVKIKKDYSKLYKTMFASVVILSLITIIIGRAYTVKAKLSLNVEKSKNHLENSLEFFKSGDFDAALAEGEAADQLVRETKLNLQSWGQNSNYMQLMEYDSEYVYSEEMINAIDAILEMCRGVKNEISRITDSFSGDEIETNKDINLFVDITRIKNFINEFEKKNILLEDNLDKVSKNEKIFSEEELYKIKSTLNIIDDNINSAKNNFLPIAEWYLGSNVSRKIMLLFQNNAEIRGSGGFLGSYAIIESENNTIKKINFQTNIYKLDTLAKEKINIESPEELKTLANGKIYLRDANYSVDGPENFSRVAEMYKLESGENIDGILAIDTSLITKLLQVTGSIKMDKYGLEINNNNFLKDVQTEVEQNYFQREGNLVENEPKKILADMMPILINNVITEIKNTKNRKEIIKVLIDCLKGKHILLYSKDKKIQDSIQYFNYGAEVKKGQEYDYLYSHSLNIDGKKSSLNILESITDNITFINENTVNHDILLERTHNGDGVWPDGDNKNFIRFLMPKNSIIENISPIDGNFLPHMDKKYRNEVKYTIGEESERKKVSFWMNTVPQTKSKLKMSINSNAGISKNDRIIEYKLLLQKQPGTLAYPYNINITAPNDYLIMGNGQTKISFNISIDSDKMIILSFKHK